MYIYVVISHKYTQNLNIYAKKHLILNVIGV